MEIKLVMGKSKIHGFGIISERSIKGGEVFYRIAVQDVLDSPKRGCAFIGDGKWVNDTDVLNLVNHSCDSNAVLDISGEQPLLITKRNIMEGEEITVDYNETEKGGVKIPCNCESKDCRGYFLRIE